MSAAAPTLGACPRSVSCPSSGPPATSPQAIESLTAAVRGGADHVTLLGATGTGKTFTIANVVERSSARRS